MPTIYQITSFIKHKLYEVNAHSLHSPSLYQLYTECFETTRHEKDDPRIEEYRDRLQNDNRKIEITDFGAGSRINNKSERTVSSIARGGITSGRIAKLIARLARYFQCTRILELGTAFGTTTMYLASLGDPVRVATFEGSMAIADIAEKAFNEYGYKNIELIRGDIRNTLSDYMAGMSEVDMVFCDATHTLDATLSYIDRISSKLSGRGVLIIDDIYWSKEMTGAWEELKQRFHDSACIDIYRCGIILLDPGITACRMRFIY